MTSSRRSGVRLLQLSATVALWAFVHGLADTDGSLGNHVENREQYEESSNSVDSPRYEGRGRLSSYFDDVRSNNDIKNSIDNFRDLPVEHPELIPGYDGRENERRYRERGQYVDTRYPQEVPNRRPGATDRGYQGQGYGREYDVRGRYQDDRYPARQEATDRGYRGQDHGRLYGDRRRFHGNERRYDERGRYIDTRYPQEQPKRRQGAAERGYQGQDYDSAYLARRTDPYNRAYAPDITTERLRGYEREGNEHGLDDETLRNEDLYNVQQPAWLEEERSDPWADDRELDMDRYGYIDSEDGYYAENERDFFDDEAFLDDGDYLDNGHRVNRPQHRGGRPLDPEDYYDDYYDYDEDYDEEYNGDYDEDYDEDYSDEEYSDESLYDDEDYSESSGSSWSDEADDEH